MFNMNALLEKAIKRLEDLPKNLQDVYASIIFDELENEVKWNKLFARTSGKQIKKMEQMVHSDLKKGVTSLSQFLKAQ